MNNFMLSLRFLLFRNTTIIVPSHRRQLDEVNAKVVNFRWYARGVAVRHYAADLFAPVTLCMRRGWFGTSSSPEPTLIGVSCLRCVLEDRRARRLARAAQDRAAT